MRITDRLVLPADVVLVPVTELPASVRARVGGEDGDYAVTRPLARTPSRIVDSEGAGLLQEFQTPQTIVEAVLRYSRARARDAERTLEDAYPLLLAFINAGLLVPPDSEGSRHIAPSLREGDRLNSFEVVANVQVLEDTELYQVRCPDGRIAALKIVRPGFGRGMERLIEREASILRHLDGTVTPRVIEAGRTDGRPFLTIGWCPGVHASETARELRREPGRTGRPRLLALCLRILDVYARLHRQGVIHADVHDPNLLVDRDGSVRIVDFGLARMPGHPGDLGTSPRGGVGFFAEPEYARAWLAGSPLPQPTPAGEQYSLAALLYFLVTGSHYLSFSLHTEEMVRQLGEQGPLPFPSVGAQAWPELETILARALNKDPDLRFSEVAEFAAHLAALPAARARVKRGAVSAPARIPRPLERLLAANLERLGAEGPLLSSAWTVAPTCSVYLGAAGVAHALYRIACVRGDAALLAAADLWVTKASAHIGTAAAFHDATLELTPEKLGPSSGYHTASGVHAVQALVSHAMGDVISRNEAVEAFLAASRAPCPNLDLTLGRASTLLAASLLLDTAPGHPGLLALGGRVIGEIWDRIATLPPVRDCREIEYLGIAHGWAGILYGTLRWCGSARAPLPGTFKERLEQLAQCAEPAGRGVRWKITLPSGGYMPGWCNGSAGMIHLWTLAHRVLGDDAFLALAEGAAWNTWEQPDMTHDLCCGLAGWAYGLLNFYNHTGDGDWLRRARELGRRAALGIGTSAFRRESLYKGEAGVAVLAADLSAPDTACMPFFEAERWPARPP
ncbi:MAG: protein kinase [Gemmatimonadetes bacterium]|nr:protein kinase [Gemmatimonadota bacterium]